jgi:hypothetical protein
MHEWHAWHVWKALVRKNESFSSYLKDLKLSIFSDIYTINKAHNKFLTHELKMRFNLLYFVRKLVLMLLRKTPPALEHLYLR